MTTPEPDFTYLLTRLLQKVPHTTSAVLLSADGIAKCWDGLHKDQADTLGAIASSMCSLASQVGIQFSSGRGGVQQVACEAGECVLLVAAAGEGSVLAVVAERDVNVGNLGYEMSHLAKQLPDQLSTPARTTTSPAGTTYA